MIPTYPECTTCPLKPAGSFIPSDVGSPFMIVGEQPGDTEVKEGKVFVGPSGILLNSCLDSLGLKRDQFFITNAVRCYTHEKVKPPKAAKECCRKILLREIKDRSPIGMLLLGSEATQAVLGSKIMETRGFVEQYDQSGTKIPYLATVHPAALFRNRGHADLFASDLKRFKEQIVDTSGKPIIKVDVKYVVVDKQNVEQATQLLCSVEELAFDIETDDLSLGSRLRCVSFSIGEMSFVYPIEENRSEDAAFFLAHVSRVLSSNAKKIAQNGVFDITRLNKRGIEVKNMYFDTMLAHHATKTYLPNDLDTLISLYTTLPRYSKALDKYVKEVGDYSTVPDEELYEYSALDVYSTYIIYKHLLEKVKEDNVDVMFFDILIPMIQIIADMQLRGVLVDTEYLKEPLAKLGEYVEELKSKMCEVAGEEFNPNSTKQLAHVLFNVLKLPVISRSEKTNAPSTDKGTLKKLAGMHPIIGMISSIRSVNRLLSTTFGETFFNAIGPDSRVRTSFKLGFVKTCRLSSEQPNMMNIPKGTFIKRAFTVPTGWKFNQYDLSQAEIAVAAHLSGDETLIAALEAGTDIHLEIAAITHEKPKEAITPLERMHTKEVVFGILYGRGAKSISDALGITEDAASSLINAFFAKFPKLRVWIDATVNFARRNKFLQNHFGYKIHFPAFGDLDDHDERTARDFPPQSTVACCVLRAMIDISRQFKERRMRAGIVLQLHDAIMVEAPEEEEELVNEIVIAALRQPIPILNLSLSVDLISDKYWNDGYELSLEDMVKYMDTNSGE